MAADTKRAKELFFAAAEMTDAAARAAYLDQQCSGNAALRTRVEALLKAHAEPDEVLDQPAVALAKPAGTIDYAPISEKVGSMIGPYKLKEQIGEGGFGLVFVAEQQEPFKRKVALKVIKPGMDTREVLARFTAERQALALMDHPNIARVLDAGATDSGRPYFVMELVRGISITDYCDKNQLSPRDRLDLFVTVCQAVQHAHQKGIIHRDIKPSNVLVTSHDGKPVAKVIDFGVAKAIHQQLSEHSIYTGVAQMIGTPLYMSPEQAEMSGLDIDTRSDIYSLGVLLYELLTGTTPLDKKRVAKAAYDEIRRLIREEEPPKPSTRLSTSDSIASIAAQRHMEPAKLSKFMKGELDWVVMKALEKDRTRRYETANGLARDIQRYLADEVVEARPPSTGYRLKKFVRRHKPQVALAGMVALLLLGGGSAIWWQRESGLRRQLVDEQRAAADSARLGRNAEAVASLLGQTEESLRAGDAKKAEIALDAARKRVAEGGAETDAPRLGLLAADLLLLKDLDAIDQLRWTWVDNSFTDPVVVAKRTREALSRFGVDPDAESVEQAAVRVNGSVIKERIVPALDRLMQQEKSASVRTVLQRVDADPYRDAVRNAMLANDRTKIAELADDQEAMKQPSWFAVVLGNTEAIPVKRRRELLEAAVIRRSGDVALLMAMATVSFSYPIDPKESAIECLRWYQAALAADPGNVAALTDLGTTLSYRGQTDAAILLYKKAIVLQPTMALAHNNLGSELAKTGRLNEAIECYRKAVEFNPNNANFHENLGIKLMNKDRLDEAIECFKRAIAIHPRSARAHAYLGNSLQLKGQMEMAIGSFRKAIELDPKSADAHFGLGEALRATDRVDDAIVSLRRAIELDPKLVITRLRLGAILCDVKKDYDAAITCFRNAIELDPKSADAHTNLGCALGGKGLVDEAVVSLRTAIAIDPKHVNARCNLAGIFAMAAAGQGKNAAPRNESERMRLRQQALEALREALALSARQLETGSPADRAAVKRGLREVQEDANLASIRDAVALAKLPAEEHKTFTQLWAAVAALQAKNQTLTAEAAKTPTSTTPSADKPDQVVLFLEQTLKQQKARFGPDHLDTLTSMHNLAEAYENAGKLDLALPLFEETLKLSKAKLGPEDPRTLETMNSLGVTYWKLGQTDKSVPLFEGLVKVYEAQLGRDHPKTIHAAISLGVNYRDAGRLKEAIPLIEETLTRRKVTLGPEHPDTLESTQNLAIAYWRGNQFEKSIPLFEEIWKFRKAKFGQDNPSTLQIAELLGVNYRDAGRLPEAIPLLEETLTLRKGTLGFDHPATLSVQHSLAKCYVASRQFAKAGPLLQNTVDTQQRTLGLDHQETLNTRFSLGLLYKSQGLYEKAEPELAKVAELNRKKSGAADWTGINATCEIADMAANRGDYQRAEEILTERLTSVRQSKGDQKLATLRIELGLANIAQSRGDNEASAKQHAALLERAQKELGDDHWLTLVAMNNVGYALARGRKFAEAEKTLQETIERQVRALGEGHLNLLQTRTNLGELYQLRGDHARAEELLRKCLAEREQKEPNSFRLASTQSMLGRVLAEQKKFAEAESLLLAGYKGLKDNPSTTPGWGKYYLPDTLDWLTQLYEAMDKKDEAAKWRKEMEALKAAPKPEAKP